MMLKEKQINRFCFNLFKTLFLLVFSYSCVAQLSAQEELQGIAARAISEKENVVAGFKSRLNTCRSKCQNNPTLRKTINSCSQTANNNCLRAYTSQECDTSECSLHKSNYGYHKIKLENMNQAQQDVKQRQQTASPQNSAINQVRSQKQNNQMLSVVAAGSTAFLAMKGRACAAQCGSSGGGCCSMAGMYYFLAAAAGLQTVLMQQKTKDLGKTCSDMSVNGVCDVPDLTASGANGGLGDNLPSGPLPPGCETNPKICEPGFFISSEGCAPGQTDCVLDDPTAALVANKLKNSVTEPKGGWPKGENPFTMNKEFSYDNLSPEQQSEFDKTMGDFNQRKQKYLAKKGFSSKAFATAGKDSKKKSKKGTDSNSDIAAAFSATSTEDDPDTGASPSYGKRSRKGKTRNLSSINKLQNMFKNMAGSSKEMDALAGMSVSVGQDNVGVREDNIFLMVHRMNRVLDEQEKRFIADF